jgi:hypothetical protein
MLLERIANGGTKARPGSGKFKASAHGKMSKIHIPPKTRRFWRNYDGHSGEHQPTVEPGLTMFCGDEGAISIGGGAGSKSQTSATRTRCSKRRITVKMQGQNRVT